MGALQYPQSVFRGALWKDGLLVRNIRPDLQNVGETSQSEAMRKADQIRKKVLGPLPQGERQRTSALGSTGPLKTVERIILLRVDCQLLWLRHTIQRQFLGVHRLPFAVAKREYIGEGRLLDLRIVISCNDHAVYDSYAAIDAHT